MAYNIPMEHTSESSRAHRPLSLVLLFLCYLASPLAIILQASMVNHLPLWGSSSVWFRLHPADMAVLLLYPLAAFSIYSVKKAGWWIFMGASAVLAGYNILVFLLKPSVGLFSVIACNLILFGVAGWFFRRHVIAPYFNPRLRDWSMALRHQARLGIEVHSGGQSKQALLRDISGGGVFIVTNEAIPPSAEIELVLTQGSGTLNLKGRVMRAGPAEQGGHGYGIMFVQLQDEQKKELSRITTMLEILPGQEFDAHDQRRLQHRVALQPKSWLESAGARQDVSLDNISLSGCAISGSEQLTPGGKAILSIESPLLVHLPATVIWSHQEGHAWHHGLQFVKVPRATSRGLRAYLKILDQLNAEIRPGTNPEVRKRIVEETLQRSPYSAIYRIKKLFGRP